MRKVRALVDGVPLAFVHLGVALTKGKEFEMEDAGAAELAEAKMVEDMGPVAEPEPASKTSGKAKATTAEKE